MPMTSTHFPGEIFPSLTSIRSLCSRHSAANMSTADAFPLDPASIRWIPTRRCKANSRTSLLYTLRTVLLSCQWMPSLSTLTPPQTEFQSRSRAILYVDTIRTDRVFHQLMSVLCIEATAKMAGHRGAIHCSLCVWDRTAGLLPL